MPRMLVYGHSGATCHISAASIVQPPKAILFCCALVRLAQTASFRPLSCSTAVHR